MANRSIDRISPKQTSDKTTQHSVRFWILVGSAFFVIALVSIVCITALWSTRFGETRGDFNLRRVDFDEIRISWGTGSGVNISPRGTLEFRSFAISGSPDADVHQRSTWELPSLTTQNEVWMHVVDPRQMESAVPASFVNPKLDNAVDRMFQMLELKSKGEKNADFLTRIAAQSYIYLGYVVLDEDDATALKSALADRSTANLDEDLITPEKTLYRLRPGVEQHFVDDPDDEAALGEARKLIPVMFESINTQAGHPGDVMHVLYLDSHIEAIPFGERFPAVPGFMDAFPPPDSKE